MSLRRAATDVGDWGTRDAASLERDRVNSVIDFDHNSHLQTQPQKEKSAKGEEGNGMQMLVMKGSL